MKSASLEVNKFGRTRLAPNVPYASLAMYYARHPIMVTE
jgi:hypothetical protein